jgi:lysophospholipase L1-like esterase
MSGIRERLLMRLLGSRYFRLSLEEGAFLNRLGLRYPRYRPHHYMLYELHPKFVSASGLNRHNDLGMRGNDVKIQKADGIFRIVCMGESTTYSTGIDDDKKTYPSRLEYHLSSLFPQGKFEVLNFGVGGYTTAENLLNYHFRIRPLKPDLIVYYFTHNDVHPRRFPKISADYREYSKSWFEKTSTKGLGFGREVTGYVRRYEEIKGAASNIRTNGPETFSNNMRSLVSLVESWGTALLFVLPPYFDIDNAKFPEYESGRSSLREADWGRFGVYQHRNEIMKICRESEAKIYDLQQDLPYPEVKVRGPGEHPLYLDMVHYNEKGCDLMGKHVANAVVSLFRDKFLNGASHG